LLCALFALLLSGGCTSIHHALPRDFPPGVVVLSFDDGPNAHADTTLRLLETLERHGIRACFSLLGVNAQRHPALVRRMAAGGHRIVNHGYAENWAVFLDEADFEANLEEGKRALEAALGAQWTPLVYRPHGGFYTKEQQRLWEQQGYQLAPSSIRIYDAVLSGADKDKALARLVAHIEKQRGGIVLLHDSRDAHSSLEAQLAKNPEGPFNRSWLPDMVKALIEVLEEKGFHLQGVDPFTVPGVLE